MSLVSGRAVITARFFGGSGRPRRRQGLGHCTFGHAPEREELQRCAWVASKLHDGVKISAASLRNVWHGCGSRLSWNTLFLRGCPVFLVFGWSRPPAFLPSWGLAWAALWVRSGWRMLDLYSMCFAQSAALQRDSRPVWRGESRYIAKHLSWLLPR